MKTLAQVRAEILARLETLGREFRKRTHISASGERVRDRAIWRPTVTLLKDGRGVRINYAPHRDGGKNLSASEARRYLAWLEVGGLGEHWLMDAPAPPTARRYVEITNTLDGARQFITNSLAGPVVVPAGLRILPPSSTEQPLGSERSDEGHAPRDEQ